MRQVVDGVWIDGSSVKVLGADMPVTMTVLRLPDDGVLLFSPLAMTPERKQAVAAIGEVRHLYAPNTWHHMWVGEWAQAYPNATLHAAPGLRKKRKDLDISRTHGYCALENWTVTFQDSLLAEMAGTNGGFAHPTREAYRAFSGLMVDRLEPYLEARYVAPLGTPFLRGDVDASGDIDISDAINVLGYLFTGTYSPICLDACDFDDSGELDLTDAVGSLSFQFVGGAAPARSPAASIAAAPPMARRAPPCWTRSNPVAAKTRPATRSGWRRHNI